jgi:hypothetical protein
MKDVGTGEKVPEEPDSDDEVMMEVRCWISGIEKKEKADVKILNETIRIMDAKI